MRPASLALLVLAAQKKALEESTGLGWNAILPAEKEWSAREVEKLRPAKK
ncbi:MAG TPA: hypothetical protein VJB14_00655 [Planctomycetota bacterium]|nr:hypothetical protein [Planctomycetota bacterium]